MSTFLGLIEEIPGISVDRFDGINLCSSIYFLSHCHIDHMQGLNNSFFTVLEQQSKYLYCSTISKAFLQAKFKLENPYYIIDIPVDRSIPIYYKKDDDINVVYVTCISAGHCPGSVMFLFEQNDQLILYTGDFRINQLDYKNITALHFRKGSKMFPKKFAKIYLDTTFLDPNFAFLPTRKESIRKTCKVIKEWLKKDPWNVVVLKCSALYGSEFLYIELSKFFNMQIHVKDCVYESYCRIPDLACRITDNPLSTRIHACVEKTHSTLICRNDILEKYILTIIPSVLKWKGKDTSIVGEWDSVKERTFNVCYSTHASFNELKAFIHYFQADEIFACVCPEGSANQINDLLYQIKSEVKKETNTNVEKREKYRLQVLEHKSISKPWTKYYSSNNDKGDI